MAGKDAAEQAKFDEAQARHNAEALARELARGTNNIIQTPKK
jgi:hypothetical protein